MSTRPENATFHAFKPSGKWYATARGHMSERVFNVFDPESRIMQMLADNGGKWPGMSTVASDMTLLVFPDAECPHGYPLMFVREKWR